jgi:hypothetical protein
VVLFFRIEDLLSDYTVMEKFSDTLGLSSSHHHWDKRRQKPVNVSQHFSTPPFEKWPPSWRREMWDMLGKEACHYGYTSNS